VADESEIYRLQASGSQLDDTILERHTHPNKSVIDGLINDGNGLQFLANDGSYKTIEGGTGDSTILFSDLAGLNRTTETVKSNSDAIAAVIESIGSIQAGGDASFISTFAGLTTAIAGTGKLIKIGADITMTSSVTIARAVEIVSAGGSLIGNVSGAPACISVTSANVILREVKTSNVYVDVQNSDLLIQNCVFSNITANVFAFISIRAECDRIRILDNVMHDISYVGINSSNEYTYGCAIKYEISDSSYSDIIISGNKIYNICGTSAIWFGGGNTHAYKIHIKNNHIYNTESFGILFYSYSGYMYFISVSIATTKPYSRCSTNIVNFITRNNNVRV